MNKKEKAFRKVIREEIKRLDEGLRPVDVPLNDYAREKIGWGGPEDIPDEFNEALQALYDIDNKFRKLKERVRELYEQQQKIMQSVDMYAEPEVNTDPESTLEKIDYIRSNPQDLIKRMIRFGKGDAGRDGMKY